MKKPLKVQKALAEEARCVDADMEIKIHKLSSFVPVAQSESLTIGTFSPQLSSVFYFIAVYSPFISTHISRTFF